MKILILLLFLNFTLSPLFPEPVMGAEAAKETVKEAAKEDVKESPAKKEEGKNSKKDQKQEEIPGEYECPYYTVHLPPDWKAFRAPEERQGIIYAIFEKNPSSPIVTIIVGPRKGAEPDLIAGLFADQFKAPKSPVQKNDQFFFSFPQIIPGAQSPITAYACLGIDGDYFMLTIYTGNQKEAQNFIKNSISSKDYPCLLPKY